MHSKFFFDKVSIEYAKTLSLGPLIKEVEPEWYEEAKDRLPKEMVGYYNFSSDGKKSLYKRTKEAVMPRNFGIPSFADENTVYNDYTTNTTVTQKPVFEETYLIQDSLLNIKWKITADTRNIAGFECRKAVGILFDTVAVFAFYTDEIMVNGGPEGINGLPGMILGVGIPRLHVTWFATKVNIATDAELKTLTPVTKGKKTNRAKMLNSINTAMKNWGNWGSKMLLVYQI
ncbi:MAG: GLPGLI family protein [Chitinophagaceae bacterium]